MRPAPRADPWEAVWAPLQTQLAPMMRFRGPPGPHFRASIFQYHPCHLLFSREGAWHELHSSNLATAVASRVPPELRPG
eukprot:3515422-Alexandrium_andersonii.AAC.1